jgi:hypothetical protein
MQAVIEVSDSDAPCLAFANLRVEYGCGEIEISRPFEGKTALEDMRSFFAGS